MLLIAEQLLNLSSSTIIIFSWPANELIRELNFSPGFIFENQRKWIHQHMIGRVPYALDY